MSGPTDEGGAAGARDAAGAREATGATVGDILARLAATIESRKGTDPATSYVAKLLARGDDAILKKIGEEATETVMAAKDGVAERIVAETADLWFHCLVMLAHHGLGPAQVLAELERREGVSGLQEKATRDQTPSEQRPPAKAMRQQGTGVEPPRNGATPDRRSDER